MWMLLLENTRSREEALSSTVDPKAELRSVRHEPGHTHTNVDADMGWFLNEAPRGVFLWAYSVQSEIERNPGFSQTPIQLLL